MHRLVSSTVITSTMLIFLPPLAPRCDPATGSAPVYFRFLQPSSLFLSLSPLPLHYSCPISLPLIPSLPFPPLRACRAQRCCALHTLAAAPDPEAFYKERR